MEALQAGQWKCPVCMISNESSALKCVACESPNPNASNVKVQEKVSAKVSGITFGSNITFGSQPSTTSAGADKETKEAAGAQQISGISFGSSNITFGSQSSNTTVDTSSEEPAKVSGITFGSSNITFGSQSSNTTVDASSEEPAKVSGVTFGGSATTFGSQSVNASEAKFGSGKVTFGSQSSTTAQEGGFLLDRHQKLKNKKKGKAILQRDFLLVPNQSRKG